MPGEDSDDDDHDDNSDGEDNANDGGVGAGGVVEISAVPINKIRLQSHDDVTQMSPRSN